MAMELQRYRFTVDEYHKMGEAGIFDEDDRVELIDGEIIEMSPINPPHAWCVTRLNKLFVLGVGDEAIVNVQNPIYLDDGTEPQPDLSLLKPIDFSGSKNHPGPSDILLVVEVAESTLGSDRKHKVPRYARAGIPEVWLINVKKAAMEVYSEPEDGKYQSVRMVGPGQTITLTMLPDVSIQTDGFLR
jgi:Uma2 family endonuclease